MSDLYEKGYTDAITADQDCLMHGCDSDVMIYLPVDPNWPASSFAEYSQGAFAAIGWERVVVMDRDLL
jgi:hypothetical protein